MKTQHSEVFHYAMAVYAAGALAVLTLPNGAQLLSANPNDVASKEIQTVKVRRDTAELTKSSVRNAAPGRDLALAGIPAKF